MAFLLRRDATYHFRCRIPTDLLDRFGRAEVKRSLDTTDHRAAKTLAARSYAAAQACFDQIRRRPVGETEDKDELIALLRDTLQKVTAQLTETTELLTQTADQLTLVTGEYTTLSEQYLEERAQRAELLRQVAEDAEENDEAFSFAREVMQAMMEERRKMEAANKIADAKETVTHVANLMGAMGIATRSTPAPKVTTFLTTTYQLEKRLQDDSHRHVVNYITMFARITGDLPMNTYGRAHILAWVRTLEKLKNSLGKSPADQEKPIKTLIAESRGRKTLNETTIGKHILHVKAMFKCAIKHHRFAQATDIDDMFDNIDLSEWVPRAQKRKSWKMEQLTALFQTPIWQGTRSRRDDVTKRAQPGPHVYRDAYWWLPVLALWTGARLEELAQLYHNDIGHDIHGTPYIKIHDEGDRRVKTESSIRNVPVHPFLVKLGFLDLFKPIALGKPVRRIFPELKAAGRLDKFGDTYSTHFTDYRRASGLYEPLRDFHSLRRTFITTLRSKYNIHPLTVAAIVGHDDELPELQRVRQTDDYTDYDISDLARVVEKLDYAALGVDVSNLLRRA